MVRTRPRSLDCSTAALTSTLSTTTATGPLSSSSHPLDATASERRSQRTRTTPLHDPPTSAGSAALIPAGSIGIDAGTVTGFLTLVWGLSSPSSCLAVGSTVGEIVQTGGTDHGVSLGAMILVLSVALPVAGLISLLGGGSSWVFSPIVGGGLLAIGLLGAGSMAVFLWRSW